MTNQVNEVTPDKRVEAGDTIKINGRFGFLINPTLKVLEVKEGMVKVISTNKVGDNEGLLSHMNESWHSIDLLNIKSF